jgi:hypothetical protein
MPFPRLKTSLRYTGSRSAGRNAVWVEDEASTRGYR